MSQLGKIGIVVGLLVGVYLVVWRWWVVSTIQCWENGYQLPAATCSVTRPLLGQPLLGLNIAAPQWSTLTIIQDEQGQWWYLTGWVKQLPNTVKLTYAQSQPVYQLIPDNQTWWLVNEAGLGQTLATPGAQLKVVAQPSWPTSVIIDSRVDSKLHDWLLAATTVAQTQSDPFQSITLVDRFTIELRWSNWVAVVAPDQDPAQQLNRLRQVRAILAEKNQVLGKDFHRVDLRFRLPVLSQ